MDNRRRHYRTRAPDVVAHLILEDTYRAEILDLSAGGAGLRFDEEIPVRPGEEVVVRITNPGFHVHLEAIVVGVHPSRVSLEFKAAIEPDLVLHQGAYELLNRRRSRRIAPRTETFGIVRDLSDPDAMAHARILDLSPHGVRVELTSQQPCLAREAKVAVALELDGVPLDLVARVVRTDDRIWSLETDTVDTPGYAEQCREVERYIERVTACVH